MKNPKQYVSIEQGIANRRDNEMRVRMQFLDHKEINRAHMVNTGMDISVARRTLAEMNQRGLLNMRTVKKTGVVWYSIARTDFAHRRLANIDNGVRIGMHQQI